MGGEGGFCSHLLLSICFRPQSLPCRTAIPSFFPKSATCNPAMFAGSVAAAVLPSSLIVLPTVRMA